MALPYRYTTQGYKFDAPRAQLMASREANAQRAAELAQKAQEFEAKNTLERERESFMRLKANVPLLKLKQADAKGIYQRALKKEAGALAREEQDAAFRASQEARLAEKHPVEMQRGRQVIDISERQQARAEQLQEVQLATAHLSNEELKVGIDAKRAELKALRIRIGYLPAREKAQIGLLQNQAERLGQEIGHQGRILANRQKVDPTTGDDWYSIYAQKELSELGADIARNQTARLLSDEARTDTAKENRVVNLQKQIIINKDVIAQAKSKWSYAATEEEQKLLDSTITRFRKMNRDLRDAMKLADVDVIQQEITLRKLRLEVGILEQRGKKNSPEYNKKIIELRANEALLNARISHNIAETKMKGLSDTLVGAGAAEKKFQAAMKLFDYQLDDLVRGAFENYEGMAGFKDEEGVWGGDHPRRAMAGVIAALKQGIRDSRGVGGGLAAVDRKEYSDAYFAKMAYRYLMENSDFIEGLEEYDPEDRRSFHDQWKAAFGKRVGGISYDFTNKSVKNIMRGPRPGPLMSHHYNKHHRYAVAKKAFEHKRQDKVITEHDYITWHREAASRLDMPLIGHQDSEGRWHAKPPPVGRTGARQADEWARQWAILSRELNRKGGITSLN